MPNVHHIRNLGQGSGQWNAWRAHEPDVSPDLAQADLKESDLAGMDLSGTILSQANLRKSDLSGSNLKGANLAGANLEEINLAGANLEGANLAGAYLLKSNLSGCNLKGANLSGAGLIGGAILSGADLTGANLAGARLSGARLSGANLTRSILAGADFRKADLSGACLSDADTSGAKFDGAVLSGTIMHGFGERRGSRKDAVEEAAPPAEEPQTDPAFHPPPPISLAPEAATTPPDFTLLESLAPEPAPPEPLASEPLASEPLVSEPLVSEPGPPEPVQTEPQPPETVYPLEQPSRESESNAETLDSILPLDDTFEEPEPLASDATAAEPARAVPVPEEGSDNTYFVYQNKDLAILALFLSNFAERSAEEKRDFLDLLASYSRHYLHVGAVVPMTTIGNAIIGGFESPSQALMCAHGYLEALRSLNVDAYACVNWGNATVRRTPDSTHEEIVPNSVSPGARLEPISNPGEVLVLEELYAHPSIDKDHFEFIKVSRRWRKMADEASEGVSVICYQVKPK